MNLYVLCPTSGKKKKFSGVDGKIIKKIFTTKWLRIKPKISQESPGSIFALAHCVLQKPTPACIQQKQSEGIPEFKLIDFET